jgi:membrane protein YqaA with SNARE-associated domain
VSDGTAQGATEDTAAVDSAAADAADSECTADSMAEPSQRSADEASAGPVISDADKRRMQLLAAVPVGFALAAYAGQIFFAALLARAPLLLLSLNATDPILLGVAHQAPLWVFMAIGLTRLFITDPFLYRLGYDYGPNAKAYLAAELGPRSRVIRTMDWLERWFLRAGWLLLFAIPGYPMCLLSGIARMRQLLFVVVNLAGTITRLALVWWVADLFSGPLGSVIDFINRYSIPFTVVMFVLVAVQTARNQRRNAAGSPKE